MLIRELGHDDWAWRDDTLQRAWGSTSVARKGECIDAAGLPGLVAVVDERRVGLLTHARRGDALEVVTIHVEHEGRGTGRALMNAVLGHAHRTDAQRLWLTTTNDNIRAFRFYQQWGMDLVALHRDGVAVSRLLKSSIPTVGHDRIPVRHELEFELRLAPSTERPLRA